CQGKQAREEAQRRGRERDRLPARARDHRRGPSPGEEPARGRIREARGVQGRERPGGKAVRQEEEGYREEGRARPLGEETLGAEEVPLRDLWGRRLSRGLNPQGVSASDHWRQRH